MTSIANAVLGQLKEPGRTIVFCDDTDLAGTPVSGLADLRIHRETILSCDTTDRLEKRSRRELKSIRIRKGLCCINLRRAN